MQISRTVETAADPARVFAYLGDFTSTNDWDPGTVRTERTSGDGGVGTVYANTSRFAGRESELTYVVTQHEPPGLVQLRGENPTVTTLDTIRVEPMGAGTRVTYTAEFTFHGVARLLVLLGRPLMAIAFKRLGDEAERGLSEALSSLPATD